MNMLLVSIVESSYCLLCDRLANKSYIQDEVIMSINTLGEVYYNKQLSINILDEVRIVYKRAILSYTGAVITVRRPACGRLTV